MTANGILSAILIGIVVGTLGRLILPGRQSIGVISTITVVGTISGARLGHRLSPRTLRRGFAWLLLAVGLFVLVRQIPGR